MNISVYIYFVMKHTNTTTFQRNTTATTHSHRIVFSVNMHTLLDVYATEIDSYDIDNLNDFPSRATIGGGGGAAPPRAAGGG
jgi:hypothetical protein